MYIDDEREAFFVDAHRKYHSKMENVCRAYVQYNEEYRSLIDESIQEFLDFLVSRLPKS